MGKLGPRVDKGRPWVVELPVVIENLGRALKDLRKSRGFTQEGLAAAIGKSREAVKQFERGTSRPALGTLFDLLEALDASLLDLHYGIEGTSPPSAATPAPPVSADREVVRRAAIEAIERIAQIASFATMGENAERSGNSGGGVNGEPLPVRREVK